jgi:glycosyltransferase involved in cell wall biosynthesis
MIIVVGPFPPPVHGASVVTQRVADKIIADERGVILCNTSPGNIAGRTGYHLKRCLAYVRCCRVILHCDRGTTQQTTVYLALSGGLGLLYELVIVALARCKRLRIIFHHHSFSYLTKRSCLMRTIIRIAGKNQLHIALSPNMASKLAELYEPLLRSEVISNLAFIDPLKIETRERADRPLKVIGYLSNISFDKGIDRFLDLMSELRAKGSKLSGRIAGPFADAGVKKYVETRIAKIGGVEYVGPVFDENKAKFLSSIDLLVFPTRYVNEAQPLVVYEAQAAGVVVSASNRGCISEMIPAELLLDAEASDFGGMVKLILTWETAPKLFLPTLREAVERQVKLAEQQLADSRKFRSIVSLYK